MEACGGGFIDGYGGELLLLGAGGMGFEDWIRYKSVGGK